MAKLPGPLDIYPFLPGTNCKECGEANCMAFATKMAEHTVKITDCTPLYAEAKYAKKLAKLEVLVRPPVREIVIGIGAGRMAYVCSVIFSGILSGSMLHVSRSTATKTGRALF